MLSSTGDANARDWRICYGMTKFPLSLNSDNGAAVRPRRYTRLFVGNATVGGVLDVLDIFVKRAALRFVRRHYPRRTATRHFSVTNIDVQHARTGVDSDHVAVLY